MANERAHVDRVLVHVHDKFKPGAEAQAVLRECERRELPVDTFALKRLRRRQLDLAPTTLVAGDLDAMTMTFGQLGLEPSLLRTYPPSLHSLFLRRIWESTVGELRASGKVDVFVKPRDREKRFTGFVYGGPHDALGFHGTSATSPVYCSDVVEFVSEFRAYVVDGSIRGVAQYAGQPAAPPVTVAETALGLLARNGESVAGHSIDFGRLADGREALVECNEGFGLGLYPGIDDSTYFELLEARWVELMEDHQPD